MPILNGMDKFYKLVHLVRDFEYTYAHLPIVPNTRLGHFHPSRAEELIEFCNKNPDYHVVSIVRGTLVYANEIVPNANCLMLATGSKHPNIYCTILKTPENIRRVHLLKFDRD